MPDLLLEGKSALVTGGARRIGRAIVLELARAGANIALTYRTSKDQAEQTAAEVRALGRQALVIECDVRSEDSVRSAAEAVKAAFGGLDLLVNNAAVFERASLATLSVEAWDAMFATNTRGPFLVAREALAMLRSAQGRIVNIGSLGGMHAWADHAHYCASKAALHMLTQAMAKGFAPQVSVNCVAPGWIQLQDASLDEAKSAQANPNKVDPDADRFAARTPMRRNGSAEDVAAAVLFFCAGPAFVTGQILAVDGGLGLV